MCIKIDAAGSGQNFLATGRPIHQPCLVCDARRLEQAACGGGWASPSGYFREQCHFGVSRQDLRSDLVIGLATKLGVPASALFSSVTLTWTVLTKRVVCHVTDWKITLDLPERIYSYYSSRSAVLPFVLPHAWHTTFYLHRLSWVSSLPPPHVLILYRILSQQNQTNAYKTSCFCE